MDKAKISGERALEFVKQFEHIREAGTAGERSAAEKIRGYLENQVLGSIVCAGADGRAKEDQASGIVIRQEPFSFIEQEIQEARLIVTEPYEKEYTVTGCGGCGSTPPEGVEAPFLYVENSDEISLSYARGRIVLINGIVRRELYRELVRAGAAGFVMLSGTPLDEGEDLRPARRKVRGLEETPIQGVTVHYKDAAELVEQGASRARLVLRQRQVTRTSQNLVVRIQGTDRAQEILTVSAHYDSVPEGPGAYDNMAGAAIVMELCRYFTLHRPRRTMEFLWFGAEEKGLLGSLDYVCRHREELAAHRFNMNVDLAGQTVGGTVIGLAGEPEVCRILQAYAREAGMGVSFKNQIWGSDSNSFAWKGIPAMTLNRDGFGMHTRHDTVDLLSAWSLERSCRLLAMIAERLAQAEVFPFDRKVPKKFLEELEQYFEK